MSATSFPQARALGQTAPYLLPLRVQGRHLWAGDHIVKGLHIGGFRAPQLLMDGKLDDLDRWDTWLGSWGCTGERAFTFHVLGRPGDFHPKNYGSRYYPGLEDYCDHRANRGLHVELNGLLGAVPPDDPFLTYDAQAEHLTRLVEILRKYPMHYLQIANEGEDNGLLEMVNRFPATMFDGIVWGRTRMMLPDFPVPPDKQGSVLFHHNERPRGLYDTTRKVWDGALLSDPLQRPMIFSEPERLGQEGLRRKGTYGPGMDVYTDQARQLVHGSMLYAEILTLHGTWECGIQQAIVPTDGEILELCREAGLGFATRVIPDEASEWERARDEAVKAMEFRLRFSRSDQTPDETVDQTGSKHLYARQTADKCAVFSCEAGNAFDPRVKPGWRIVRSDPGYAYYLETA